MRLFSPKEAWLKGVASLPTRWSPVVPPLGWMSFSPFGHEPRPPLSQVIVTLRPTLLPALLSLNFLLPHSSGSGRSTCPGSIAPPPPCPAAVAVVPPPLRGFHRVGGGSKPHNGHTVPRLVTLLPSSRPDRCRPRSPLPMQLLLYTIGLLPSFRLPHSLRPDPASPAGGHPAVALSGAHSLPSALVCSGPRSSEGVIWQRTTAPRFALCSVSPSANSLVNGMLPCQSGVLGCSLLLCYRLISSSPTRPGPDAPFLLPVIRTAFPSVRTFLAFFRGSAPSLLCRRRRCTAPPPLRRFHRDGGGSEPHTRRGLREPALGQCRGCSLVCRGVPYAPRPRSRPFIPFILFKSFPRTRQGPLLHLTSPPTLLFPSHHSLCCLLRQFPLPFFSTHTRTGGCCFLPSLLEVSANPRHIAK